MDDEYQTLTPSSNLAFNTCFYCGCEATDYDFCPPTKLLARKPSLRVSTDLLKIPCCYECHDFLEHSQATTLEERVQFAKDKISRAYEKPLRIYEMWAAEEAESLGEDLKRSIIAGLDLGEEAYKRLRYPGFSYDLDGSFNAAEESDESYEVFGEVFYDFRDALEYASKTYRIQKNTLRELFFEHGNSFDDAISFVHEEVARKSHTERLENLCGEFAKRHNQPLKFVMKTTQTLLNNDPNLNIEEALAMLAYKLETS